jgi:uncharacterized cysteine cluster protein YcgN (CxxCxxCC family)
MGKFKKGESGNPKGRPVGTKNKATDEIRTRISSFIDDTFDDVVKSFRKLDDRDKLQYWTKLLEYKISKVKESELSLSMNNLTDEQVDDLFTKIVRENETN